MANPRNKLITGVSNDAGYRGDDQVPSSYALNHLFSGGSLASSVDANTLVECGNYRFNTTTTNLPAHLVGSTGLMTVMHERQTPPSTAFGIAHTSDTAPTTVRQIIWPDGPIDITPYSRTKVSGSWTSWQMLGGNLQRIRLTSNLTANQVQSNATYYSFSNFSITLPDAANYPLGTKIYLEQYSGQGSVTAANPDNAGDPFSVVTNPCYLMNASGEVTTTIVGPNLYMFEVVEEATVGVKTWQLDVDNNSAVIFSNIREQISTETVTRKDETDDIHSQIGQNFYSAAYAWTHNTTTIFTKVESPDIGNYTYEDSIFSSRGDSVTAVGTSPDTITVNSTVYTRNETLDVASRSVYSQLLDEVTSRIDAVEELNDALNNKEFRTIPYLLNSGWSLTTIIFVDANGDTWNIKNLLNKVHPVITLSTTGSVCYLPYAGNYTIGTKLTVELAIAGASSTTIRTVKSDDSIDFSEVFTNDGTKTLVLPFEVTYGANGLQWSLVIIGE